MKRKAFCLLLAVLFAVSVCSLVHYKRKQEAATQELVSQMHVNLRLLCQYTDLLRTYEKTEESRYAPSDIPYAEARVLLLGENLQTYGTLYPKDYLYFGDLCTDYHSLLQSMQYGTEETKENALRFLGELTEYLRLYTDETKVPNRKEFLQRNETVKRAMDEGGYEQLHLRIRALH